MCSEVHTYVFSQVEIFKLSVVWIANSKVNAKQHFDHLEGVIVFLSNEVDITKFDRRVDGAGRQSGFIDYNSGDTMPNCRLEGWALIGSAS